MKHTLKYKIDGYEAEFLEKSQVDLVNHLDSMLHFWKTKALTYEKAIDIMEQLLHNKPLNADTAKKRRAG